LKFPPNLPLSPKGRGRGWGGKMLEENSQI
jgi:hypothetical protein